MEPRQTHKFYEAKDIQIQVWDTGQGKEFWKGSLNQFVKDNPDDLDNKTLRQVKDGFKIFIGGGASPEFSIQKIDEAHVRKIVDAKVFYMSIECSIPEEYQKIFADLSDDYNQRNFKWNPAFNETTSSIDVSVQALTWEEALAEVFDYLSELGIETDNSIEVKESKKLLEGDDEQTRYAMEDKGVTEAFLNHCITYLEETQPDATRTIRDLNGTLDVIASLEWEDLKAINDLIEFGEFKESRKLSEKDNWRSSRSNPENEGDVVIEAGDSYNAYVTVHCFSDQEADNVVALVEKNIPNFTQMHPRWKDADGINMVLEFNLDEGGHNDQDILDSVLYMLDESDVNLLWEAKNKKGDIIVEPVETFLTFFGKEKAQKN